MESLLVVTNPDIDGSDEHLVQNAITALRAEADVHVCKIALPGDLDGALQRRGSRKVVVAGDDKILHTVVAALHRRNELDDTVLAILPDGPESDFARGAGIPTDPIEAAHVVLAGVERRFDLLIDCRGDVVVNTVQLGLSGRPLRTRIWSAGRSEDAVEADLGFGHHEHSHPRAKPFHVRIEADDTLVADFDRPVLQVAVTNAPPYAEPPTGGAAPDGVAANGAAEADPADGYADVVVNFAVDPISRARRALMRSGHDDADTLTVRARRVSVAGQRFWLNSDGQDSGTERRCTWNVVPQLLRVIVPATGEG
ncbi:diacylglycerol/lipid kinase family protein [Actinopolymorpha pittospori]